MGVIAVLGMLACGRVNFDPVSADSLDDLAITRVAVGKGHACAWAREQLTCWGDNSEGQLGRGDLTTDPTPRVVALPPIVTFAIGDDASYAVDRDGMIWSWGHASGFTLGVAEAGQRPQPASSPVLPDIASIVSAADNACGISVGGQGTCWGDADGGQLAIGSAPDYTPPAPMMLSGIESMSIGTDHACAFSLGVLYCWGVNEHGQLGVDATLSTDSCKNIADAMVPCRLAPIAVPGLAGARAVSAGRRHTCAIGADNLVQCWGNNQYGKLGTGDTTSTSSPAPVVGLGAAVAIAAGREHTCAVLVDRSAWCWGNGANGRLGNGALADQLLPVRVDIPVAVRSIDASDSGDTTCAVDADDAVWCWGRSTEGQLVSLAYPEDTPPVRIEL